MPLEAHSFSIELAFDNAAGVWFVAGSDVPGLAAEGDSVEALVDTIKERVPELVELNRHKFAVPPRPPYSLQIRHHHSVHAA